MPYYDYRCEMGHEFEAEQSIHDEPLEACTHVVTNHKKIVNVCCSPCKRLISQTSFKFKGGAPTPRYH